MRKIISLFTVYCCFLINSSYSQVFGKKMEFDAVGQLKNIPAAKFKKGNEINLSIDLGRTELNEQKNLIKDRILYMDTLLNGFTQEEKGLKNDLVQLEAFFLAYRDTACIINCFSKSTEFRQYLKDVDDSANALNGRSSINLEVNDCIDNACLCILAREKSEKRKDILSRLYDIFETKNLIAKILCDITNTGTLFKVNEFTDSLFLKTGIADFIPQKIKIGFSYLVEKGTFKLKNDVYEAKYTIPNKFNTVIKQVNNFKETYLEWHNKAIQKLDERYLEYWRTEVTNDVIRVNNLKTFISPCDSCKQIKRDSLNSLLTLLKKYDTVWCPTSPVTLWLKNWLWFSKGEFKLNYLNFTSQEKFKSSQKSIDSSNTIIKNLTDYINKADSIKKCLSCGEKALDTLEFIQTKAIEKNKQKDNLVAFRDGLKNKIDINKLNLENFSTTNGIFHSLNIATQNTNGTQKIIYHDAVNDFEVSGKKFPFNINKKTILPDNYEVYYGFINAKDTIVQIEEKLEQFNDSAKLMQEINAGFKALAEAAAPLAQFYNPVSQFSGIFFKNANGRQNILTQQPQFQTEANGDSAEMAYLQRRADSTRRVDSVRRVADSLYNHPCDSLVQEINFRLWRFSLLHSMFSEYYSSPTPGKIESKTSTINNFITYTKKAREGNAPYTNKYTFLKEGKIINSGRYSIGRQKTFTIGAGLFFQDSSARQQQVDTTGNTFSVKNTDSRAKFVIGIKVFPFKIFEADGSLLPRFPLKRISVFGGFEITKPLENLYLGLGYDIVPGLHLSYGLHYYRKDFYKLQNNQVIDKTSSYQKSGAYYGVTIDPIVLTGILKTLFK